MEPEMRMSRRKAFQTVVTLSAKAQSQEQLSCVPETEASVARA